MKITNEFEAPQIFVDAVKDLTYRPNEDTLYVTQLPNPPMIRHLMLKYWDEFEVDVSDMFYRLDGVALHSIIEKAAKNNPDLVAELSLSLPKDLFGMKISGRLDIWDTKKKEIIDVKNAGVMSVKLGIKPEWTFQLNVYRYMLWKLKGGDINDVASRLSIALKLRDWMASKTIEPDYPRSPFLYIPIPSWSVEKTEEKIRACVERYTIRPVPQCSDEDRWKTPDCYAIMRRGVRKAVVATIVRDGKRIPIPSYEEAERIIRERKLKGVVIEHRKGEYRRCLGYCDVRHLCRKANPELWR